MAKRYKFRKVYIICEDNDIFGQITTTLCYKDAPYALEVCNNRQRKAIEDANMSFNKGKPIPVHKVHAFYLVHDSLFEELLKQHSK